jgi:2-polyprenyl-6-methoxyphenol hydroxylase-like FAD-dependent oxidoreductase
MKMNRDSLTTATDPGVLDLPQTLVEPMLVRFATTNGFKVQFNTKLLSFQRDSTSGRYAVLVKDLVREVEYEINCKYLFGADGGRSPIATQLKLPMNVLPGGRI